MVSAPPARRGVPRLLRVLLPAALILVWLAFFGAGGSSFGQVGEVAVNDQLQHLPASADATRVHELEGAFRGDDVIPGIVVFERPGGLGDADRTAIAAFAEEVRAIEGVDAEGVSPAIFSEDGEAAQLFVPVDTDPKPAETVERLRAALDAASVDGLSAHVTGPAGLSADIVGAFRGLDGLVLLVALAAVLVILVIVYRSPMLPLIVLGTSVVALTVAMSVVVQLAKAGVVVLSGQTQGILMILVIGAATDYALLYVARYREALRDHAGGWEATWAALRGSTPPIVASAGTVILGVLCLLFSELNSNRALGPVAAIGIAAALLASLTLLPALLLWAGRAAFWPLRPAFGSPQPAIEGADAAGLWPRVARLVSRRSRLVWVACAALLGVASLGLLGFDADGVPQSEFVLGESQARDGQAILTAHFPGGSGTPALVIVPEGALAETAGIALANDGVDSLAVTASASPRGTLAVGADGAVADGGAPTIVDGRVMLQATLADPGDSPAAEQTVRELREALGAGGIGAHGADALVGGVTATAIDTIDASVHDRTLVIPLVLAVILLVLMLLLRAVVAAAVLLGTVVLSYAAALGISAVVFSQVFGFPGADPSVPLFAFVFLVALGVDYNIFLMTRVREESLLHGTQTGIRRGLVATGGVITSAGVVLAATFAALGVLPVLFLAQISFIVALGVLIDTVIVRSLLVPALASDIGRAVWWPSRLARAPLSLPIARGSGDVRAPGPAGTAHDRGW